MRIQLHIVNITGCETTLITLVETWKKARDESLVVNILSTDMFQAFDSLCNNRIRVGIVLRQVILRVVTLLYNPAMS